LSPLTIILTKLAEFTNNPPVFVFANVLIVSPLWFRSWVEAEQLTSECEMWLEQLLDEESRGGQSHREWQQQREHQFRTLLIWLLEPRILRYVVNMATLLIVILLSTVPSLAVWILALLIVCPSVI